MKTIEEAAKECAFHAQGNKHHFTDEKIFRYGVEFAQRWIPVEEELPEIGEKVPVLLSTKKWSISSRKVYSNGKIGWTGSGTFIDSIIAWRPIEIK